MADAAKPKTAEPKIATGTIEGFKPPAKPARTGGGKTSKYPFDSLGVGEFFTVTNKNKRQMASPVNNANKKYRNVAKDAAGNPQATTQEREFYAVDVDADTAKRLKGTPHEGATAMVVRSK